jgi:hypothetical protein
MRVAPAKALDRSHQAFKAAQRLASVQTISDKGKAALRKVGLHILIARGYEAILNIANEPTNLVVAAGAAGLWRGFSRPRGGGSGQIARDGHAGRAGHQHHSEDRHVAAGGATPQGYRNVLHRLADGFRARNVVRT